MLHSRCVSQTWVRPWLNYSSPAGKWKWLTAGNGGRELGHKVKMNERKNVTEKRRSSSKPVSFKQGHQGEAINSILFLNLNFICAAFKNRHCHKEEIQNVGQCSEFRFYYYDFDFQLMFLLNMCMSNLTWKYGRLLHNLIPIKLLKFVQKIKNKNKFDTQFLWKGTKVMYIEFIWKVTLLLNLYGKLRKLYWICI